jgi:cytochrome c2
MVQHQVLMLLAGPLLVLGRPFQVWPWALPRHWRGGLHRLLRTRGGRAGRAAVTAPLVIWLGAAAVFGLWHLPVWFEAALRSPALHALQHLGLLGGAIASWQVAIHARHRVAGYGLAVLWLFASSLYTGLLGALLTLSPVVWYAGGTADDPSRALAQQQLGGLVMWVPSSAVHAVAGLAFFAAWLRATGRRAAARDAAGARRRLAAVLAVATWLGGCGAGEDPAVRLTGGDPGRGQRTIKQYGCETCHRIPGVSGAAGTVGPPLDRMARRSFVAGRLSNSPENLIQWIRDPQAVDPRTAMPDTGVTDQDARDIAAYLYTLR